MQSPANLYYVYTLTDQAGRVKVHTTKSGDVVQHLQEACPTSTGTTFTLLSTHPTSREAHNTAIAARRNYLRNSPEPVQVSPSVRRVRVQV